MDKLQTMTTYDQIKKFIKKLKHKTSKDSSDDFENNNDINIRRKRPFKLFRHNKKSIKRPSSLDLSPLNVSSSSNQLSCYSENILLLNNDDNLSIKLENSINHIQGKPHEIITVNNKSDSVVERHSESSSINSPVLESNSYVHYNFSSQLQKYFTTLLYKLFYHPDKFYMFLSYVITIFLILSTLYVKYQIGELEKNVSSLTTKKTIASLKNNKYSKLNSVEMNRFGNEILTQIQHITKLVKHINKEIDKLEL